MNTLLNKLIALFIFSFLIGFNNIQAQSCNSCTNIINQTDTSTYTINAGQTFCIDTLGVFSGNLILNGGSICNKGIFKPKTFTISSGNFTNYGNVTLKSNFLFPTNFLMNNNFGAVLNALGSIQVNGASLTNDGLINCNLNIEATSGTITNTNLINCNFLNAPVGVVNNTGTINTNQ
jgi:hypothetical protein